MLVLFYKLADGVLVSAHDSSEITSPSTAFQIIFGNKATQRANVLGCIEVDTIPVFTGAIVVDTQTKQIMINPNYVPPVAIVEADPVSTV